MTNDDSRKLDGRRINAKEVAEFLGVPYQIISRIDRQGEYIKRYRLGHKTYVYDVDSMHAFLEAKLVRRRANRSTATGSQGGARDAVNSSGVSTMTRSAGH
ncbi:hypothetical protein [Burkholderia multivorans]|uniref:hypothetical protein n=1 Tax=Burkholderia multivorans TaxID=87883 RepID=UPI0011B25968|nr:hypothetical protein [Burkholderia multivorans]MDN8050207.1 hypothetical protein [Burkholderia multivorans]